jgi:glycosyltransferase involved in cell wall biosynthesis
MQKTKILFFTPSYTRGGSEMYLYYLLENIDASKFDVMLYVDGQGELTNEKLNYKIVTNNIREKSFQYYFNKIVKKIFNYNANYSSIKKIHKTFKPDLWYFNTSVMPKYVSYAQLLSAPYVVHFHELYSVHDKLSGSDLKNMIDKAESIIACSNAVKHMINNIRTENVFVQYEHVAIDEEVVDIGVRSKYGIPENAFLWLMSGQKNHRKGYDLIPKIANHLIKTNSYVVWLGGDRNFGINQLVNSSQLKNLIEPGLLKGKEYKSILNAADAFVLTSREDPFPLVMIEASSKKLPIISFDSGGVTEFVERGMGKVVPNCDVQLLLDAMSSLMDGDIKIDEEKMIEKSIQFDVVTKTKEWERLINNIINNI